MKNISYFIFLGMMAIPSQTLAQTTPQSNDSTGSSKTSSSSGTHSGANSGDTRSGTTDETDTHKGSIDSDWKEVRKAFDHYRKEREQDRDRDFKKHEDHFVDRECDKIEKLFQDFEHREISKEAFLKSFRAELNEFHKSKHEDFKKLDQLFSHFIAKFEDHDQDSFEKRRFNEKMKEIRLAMKKEILKERADHEHGLDRNPSFASTGHGQENTTSGNASSNTYASNSNSAGANAGTTNGNNGLSGGSSWGNSYSSSNNYGSYASNTNSHASNSGNSNAYGNSSNQNNGKPSHSHNGW